MAAGDVGVRDVFAYFAAENRGAMPECFCPVLFEFVRHLYDRNESLDIRMNSCMTVNEWRAPQPFIWRLMGTDDTAKEFERARVLSWGAITKLAPMGLRLLGFPEHVESLKSIPYRDWKEARDRGNSVLEAIRALTPRSLERDAVRPSRPVIGPEYQLPKEEGAIDLALSAISAAERCIDMRLFDYYATDAGHFAADVATKTILHSHRTDRPRVWSAAFAVFEEALYV